MPEARRITVDVDEETHYRVRVRAAQARLSISDVMRGLLRLWLACEVRLENAPPNPQKGVVPTDQPQ